MACCRFISAPNTYALWLTIQQGSPRVWFLMKTKVTQRNAIVMQSNAKSDTCKSFLIHPSFNLHRGSDDNADVRVTTESVPKS